MSTTLKGLPREKVGEDLSRHVLRIAERRMLSEGEPSETDVSAQPEPLARMVVRRFFNRRAMAWAGLAVAIAIMIRINEWRNSPGPHVGMANKEVARAPLASEEMARKPGPPPSIHAAGRSDMAMDRKTAAPAIAHSEPERNMAPATAVPLDRVAEKKPAKTASESAVTSPSSAKSAAYGQQPLIVRCDIDARASEGRAFEKLLDANGIAWRAETPAADLASSKKRAAKDEKQLRYGGAPSSGPAKLGEDRRLYADATPAQVTAILAGLAAQPKVFLAVDVSGNRDILSVARARPPADQPWDESKPAATGLGVVNLRTKASNDVVAKNAKAMGPGGAAPRKDFFQFEQKARVAGPTAQRGAVGQLDVTVRESELAQSAPAAQAMPRQPVLFVLHVVGTPSPAAAAQPAEASKRDK